MDKTLAELDEQTGVRFGRTLIVPLAGPLLSHEVQGIVTPANRRGVMGAGFAGQIRMAAGGEVEREAMALAPLTIGAVVATSGGRLQERGVTTIIHAVVSESLGSPTRVDIVRTAIGSAMAEADRQRLRSLLIPAIGAGLGPGRLPSGQVAVVTIEVVVAHMRRFATRLERIVLPQQSEADVLDVSRALKEARELWWG